MLRILRNDVETDRVVLRLEGRIVAEWADLVEREGLESIRSGLDVGLDLSGVALIGHSGLEALRRLGLVGVRIIGCSPLIADMLEEEGIVVDRSPGSSNDRTIPGSHEPR